MIGLMAVVFVVGLSVLRHDANAVVALDNCLPTLYLWYLWTTIISQVFYAFASTVFLCNVICKEEDVIKKWVYCCISGICALFSGCAYVLGTSLLIKAFAGHPTTLTALSLNVVVPAIIAYVVGWHLARCANKAVEAGTKKES